MSVDDIKDLISNAADTTADRLIKGLKKQRFLKDKKLSAYQKTEQVLYNYNNFKETIKDKREQILEISSVGLKTRSKDITFYHSGGFTGGDDYDVKIEEKIKSIEDSITLTERYIKTIDAALDKLRDDKYFDIIIMKYFQNTAVDAIAEYFDVDTSTINRNKNRLINQLKITLFSDEVIQEMLS